MYAHLPAAALSREQLEVAMTLFAAALYGGPVPIALRPRYDDFSDRAHNAGACRVDILRQVIVLQESQARRTCSALERDRILWSDYPGARVDLDRARRLEVGQELGQESFIGQPELGLAIAVGALGDGVRADGGQLHVGLAGASGSTAQVPERFHASDALVQEAFEHAPLSDGRLLLEGAVGGTQLGHHYHREWHYQARTYLPAWCRVLEHRLKGERFDFLQDVRTRHPDVARAVRRRLQAIRPQQLRRQARNVDGEELDLDAVVTLLIDQHTGYFGDDRVFFQRRPVKREVSAAFLLDMSGSTNISMPAKKGAKDAAVEFESEDSPYLYGGGMFAATQSSPPVRRVIDVAKDALALMCDGLHRLGDSIAVYGFSGDGRQQVDFYIAKEFDEAMSGRTWAALAAMEPKRSSRLGPAIRHAARKFERQIHVQRLLIVISDGYPQDNDYGPNPDDVDYGIQDSAKALEEARQLGIATFFITIDPAGQDYLGRICSEESAMLIQDIEELPLALSKAYADKSAHVVR